MAPVATAAAAAAGAAAVDADAAAAADAALAVAEDACSAMITNRPYLVHDRGLEPKVLVVVHDEQLHHYPSIVPFLNVPSLWQASKEWP